MTARVVSKSDQETRDFAARLARGVRPGDLICLRGPLGSGKTTFVQGFARGVGFRDGVVSPSFGIAREYRTGRRLLYHLDLFRVEPRELPNLDIEEYLRNPHAVCLVEWPEVAKSLLPDDRLEIRFSHRRPGGRVLRLSARGPRSRGLLRFDAAARPK